MSGNKNSSNTFWSGAARALVEKNLPRLSRPGILFDMRIQRHWLRVSVLALLCLRMFAQTPTANSPRPRPRIGVALGGGGALGLAHIGVIKWLEDHRIPVDYISRVPAWVG